jgi:molybdopterin converting factor small subunit
VADVVLPRSLVALFPGTPRRMSSEGTTVREVIEGVDRQVPGFAERVLSSGPAIREHINVFVDGEVADVGTRVGPASTVHIIPAVSGG